MKRKLTKILQEMAFIFFSMAVILGAIAYCEPEKIEPINEIFAEYSPIQPGVPDNISGVWHNEDTDLYITETQIIIKNKDKSETIYPSATLVQSEFDYNNIEDTEERTLYIIYCNPFNFEQDNQENTELSKESLYLVRDTSTNTLILEDGRILKQGH